MHRVAIRQNPKGYGVFNSGVGTRLVSRYILTIMTGDSGEGRQAAHAAGSCHNVKCVNPRHLRWATCRENIHDRHKDGTILQGDKSPLSKLSDADRAAIFTDPRRRAEIAKSYDISKAHVSRIKSGWVTADKRAISRKPHQSS